MSDIHSNPTNFVNFLTAHDRGRIIVCNILDGIEQNLFDGDTVRTYFDWWIGLCAHLGCKTFKDVIAALDKLTPDGLPPDFRPGVPRPSFLCSCNCSLKAGSARGTVSAVLPALVVRGKATTDSLRRIAARRGCGFLNSRRTDWGDRDLADFVDLPDDLRDFALKDGAGIGNEVLWVTQSSSLAGALERSGEKADRARDVLGLVHRGTDEVLVALHFPTSAVLGGRSGRPIFKDARSHRRFMSKARKAEARRTGVWGRTVDLGPVWEEGRLVDGLPERVCRPIDHGVLEGKAVGFTPLGRLALDRGADADAGDGDPAYADLLKAGRKDEELTSRLVAML